MNIGKTSTSFAPQFGLIAPAVMEHKGDFTHNPKKIRQAVQKISEETNKPCTTVEIGRTVYVVTDNDVAKVELARHIIGEDLLKLEHHSVRAVKDTDSKADKKAGYVIQHRQAFFEEVALRIKDTLDGLTVPLLSLAKTNKIATVNAKTKAISFIDSSSEYFALLKSKFIRQDRPSKLPRQRRHLRRFLQVEHN